MKQSSLLTKLVFTTISLFVLLNARSQTVTSIAGIGSAGFSGDGGLATAAQLNTPVDVAVDALGNIYIADKSNNRVRKITKQGLIYTIVGGGRGFGEDSLATKVNINELAAIAVDVTGNIYIADAAFGFIRKIDTAGIITTIVGTGTSGYNGDNRLAISAEISTPTGLAIDHLGNLYIADEGNNRIRKVSNGIITTVAGVGTLGYSGDEGLAISAKLKFPMNVTLDMSGNLYIVDGGNYCIRKIDTAGIIHTVAGNGISGYSGDGGEATKASLGILTDVATDVSGAIYLSDIKYNVIRVVSPTGIISTMPKSLDISAYINAPYGLDIDASGNLYVANGGNNRILKVNGIGLPLNLLAFSAKKLPNGNVGLQWQTANEINTAKFLVEAGTDGAAFKPIGEINAKGAGTNSYSFTDNASLSTNYYRLKMIDKNGSFTYSNIIKIALGEITKEQFEVSPNPSDGEINIHLALQSAKALFFQLINTEGKLVASQKNNVPEGNSIIALQMKNKLAAGIYYLKTIGINGDQTAKQVLVR
ncbi:T9SS type A sorting domain-containing protein [Parasediminibacterium sp. JCM 36343]|uniref:NHL domain-containing protein n=1 Tax=Parasediminibacterium sp. JCM 36343 TaxID=3374279 RepID=UPI003978EB45